jgi:hypothetical protein
LEEEMAGCWPGRWVEIVGEMVVRQDSSAGMVVRRDRWAGMVGLRDK